MNALSLIGKLAAAEAKVADLEFVSPVCGNTMVATRIHGIVQTFRIPRTAPGWYRVKPRDTSDARIAGPAEPDDILKYLSRLPKVFATAAVKRDGVFLTSVAFPQSQAARNPGTQLLSVRVDQPAVLLTDDSVQDFDRLVCRYDSASLWYEAIDPRNDPAKADYLRESFRKGTAPEKLKFSGLLPDEKQAYAFRTAIDKAAAEERAKRKIREDVELAGGKLESFDEKSDHIKVVYYVDGHRYTSIVAKNPAHTVISAGICLSGNDRAYDLKSLVTIMREGRRLDTLRPTHNADYDFAEDRDYDEDDD